MKDMREVVCHADETCAGNIVLVFFACLTRESASVRKRVNRRHELTTWTSVYQVLPGYRVPKHRGLLLESLEGQASRSLGFSPDDR
jgi:hypothetical protein